MAPQLAVAEQSGGIPALIIMAILSLLASFTSFNGALLTLGRLTAALAAQGILPRSLGRIEPRSLVPRGALVVLLLLALGATALVGFGEALRPSILAAAVSAAIVYAALVWVRERLPFLEEGQPRARLTATLLVAGLCALAIGVLFEADTALMGTLALLGTAYGLAVVAAYRSGRRTSPRLIVPSLREEAVHAG
jgi:amino acid transporter